MIQRGTERWYRPTGKVPRPNERRDIVKAPVIYGGSGPVVHSQYSRPLFQPVAPEPGVQMRFRTDGWNWADQDIAAMSDEKIIEIYGADELARVRATPPAEPGDVWRVFWYRENESEPQQLAGYAICCPKCRRIHDWTRANNCHWNETEHSWTDDAGKIHRYKVCGHSGKGSCWNWSGNAEQNNLTAQSSLWNQAPDCGWHGWLTDGVLREC